MNEENDSPHYSALVGKESDAHHKSKPKGKSEAEIHKKCLHNSSEQGLIPGVTPLPRDHAWMCMSAHRQREGIYSQLLILSKYCTKFHKSIQVYLPITPKFPY